MNNSTANGPNAKKSDEMGKTSEPSKYLKKAIESKLITIDERNRIFYQTREGLKKDSYKDPEEKVRADFYSELIFKYKYESKRISVEVPVVVGVAKPRADLVVYEDDAGKKPYLSVECKREGISEAEIKSAIEEGYSAANSLRCKYLIIVAGSVKIAFDVANFPPNEREQNIISDIPIRYGTVPKYTFKKDAQELVFGTGDRELRKPTKDELISKFQQCHDILWEGGKRNPAEAFDEMSKLMFCKNWDERRKTHKSEYYSFQIGTHETKGEVAERVRNIYAAAQELEPGVFVEPIKVSDSIIYSIVQILQEISLVKAGIDVKGEAFEKFLGKVFKGEMGQYFTPREIVKFMVSFLKPTEVDYVIDPACGSGGFLLEALEQVREKLEHELDVEDAKRAWTDFALQQVWGIEINSQLARVSMMNMILHEDGHTNIENADALDNIGTWSRDGLVKNFGTKFSLLVTNPPFGAEVKWTEKQYLSKYVLGKGKKQQKTEILFIERALEMLRPGGRMGIVLPDGILANSSLQYVRDFIEERAQILAIVSLPQGAFTYYGTGVKTSLVFLRKKQTGEKLPEKYAVFMAEANHIGYDTTGRKDTNEFPQILEAWEEFKTQHLTEEFTLKQEATPTKAFFRDVPLTFSATKNELEERFDVNFHKPEYYELTKKLGRTPFKLVKFGEIISTIINGVDYREFTETGKTYLRVSNIKPFKIDKTEVVKVPFDADKTNKAKLAKGDILVTRKGTFGISAFLDKNSTDVISSEIFRIRLKKEYEDTPILPKFIAYILNLSIFQSFLAKIKVGAIMGSLSQNAINELLIPLPPMHIQLEIVKLIDDALQKERTKRRQANRVYKSIDNYLLSELGITFPRSEQKKILTYIVTLDRLNQSRWDVGYWDPESSKLVQSVKLGKYATKTISNALKISNVIVNPSQNPEQSINYVDLAGINETTGEVSPTKILGRDAPSRARMRIKANDLLIASLKGSLGKIAVVPKSLDNQVASSGFFVIRDQPHYNVWYLFSLFKSKTYQNLLSHLTAGAVMAAISQKQFENLVIPFPPKDIQDKIARKVQTRINRSKQLQLEADEMLTIIKEKIEKIILGEKDE